MDILAISCDSFDEATNIDIGRHQKNIHHLASLVRIREWCKTYKVAFKINTVVNTHNWEEDMTQEILQLNPVRWKVSSTYMIIRILHFKIMALWNVFHGSEARHSATTNNVIMKT